METLSLLSSRSDSDLLQQWFDNLSERDKVLASLNAHEYFSPRTLDLQRKYSQYQQSAPPCQHCESLDHGILHCDKRDQYTGTWIDIDEQKTLDDIMFLEAECIRTLLRTIDKIIKLKKHGH